MEEKKKSTLGKAFARTFSRKSTPPAASPVASAAPSKVDEQPAPAPVSAPVSAPASATSTPSSNSSTPVSINAVPQTETVNVSNVVSAQDESPISPVSNTTHTRDGTGLSNMSATSRQGIPGEDGEGLNPADILLNRLNAFRGVVKNLQKYFAEVAVVETGISKAMGKASGVLVVPFKDGQQFLGQGGLQDVCIGIRDSSKTKSEQHADSARFVEETIVKNLRRLKQDIKGKIKALKADSSLYGNKVFKEREHTQEKIGTLAKAIGLFEMSGSRQPDMEKVNSDPFVINVALRRQLAKQIHEENLFARALKQCQEEIKTFEAHIIKEVKQIFTSYSAYQLNSGTTAFVESWAPAEAALNALQEDTEWNGFIERHGHRLFPSDLVDKKPEDIEYPCKDSPYVLPVKTAHLSRQSTVLKSWKDGYFVLTLAGWLHVFSSADQEKDHVPDHSIYIPTANLGPHAEAGQKQQSFSLDGKGKGGLLHKDAQTLTLRGNSREEMLEWWGEISKRAQSSMVSQPGQNAAISRSASVLKSSPALTQSPQPTKELASHAEETTTPIAPIVADLAIAEPIATPTEPHVEPPVAAPVSQARQAQHQAIPVRFSPLIPRPLSPEDHSAQMILLDDLMSDIGMGKFQKQLLILCGLGWFADNMWLQCIALILPRVQAQFEIQDQYIGILSSSMFIGMMFGAMFWGVLADAYGRKLAFNFTLIVTTIFGIASSFANSYWLLCILILCLGFGVGGNMPVDVAASILGYALLPRYSCEVHVEGGCQGNGWRYMLLALGTMTLSMVVGRVILFRLEESPKFLLNQNRPDEAAIVLRRVFRINHHGPQSEAFEENIETLTTRFKQYSSAEESELSSSDSDSDEMEASAEIGTFRRQPTELRLRQDTSNGKYRSLFRWQHHQLRHKFDTAIDRLRPLLSPKFRLSTTLIWAIWGLVSFAYTAFNVFYPKFLQEHGEGGNQSLKAVYRDMLIYSTAGVPGSVMATVMVEGRLGRRYTMAVSTLGTAVAIILFAVLSSHTAMTIFSAILSLLSTLNYAVLYSYTPEVFPSDIRGTACGVAAAISRL
ncbi:hypothetical protein BGZ49_002786 [Haplosporangium sp. Z 27]|nr:hypothetical protein BGZ49_002786 [Haplosporangium sp. Z 27]